MNFQETITGVGAPEVPRKDALGCAWGYVASVPNDLFELHV